MPLAELTGGDHALLEAAREVIRRNYDAAERLHTVGAAVRGPAGEEVIPPCGNCRQLLCDYAPRCGVILCVDGALKRVPAQELLPYPYRTGD